ncbi:MAG: hypothetical protein ACJ72W_24855 [Actinoallomurus sp.]
MESRSSVEVEARLLEPFCREGLAGFKRPRAVLFVESLPTTATGKIQRYLVRDDLREAGLTPTTPGDGARDLV